MENTPAAPTSAVVNNNKMKYKLNYQLSENDDDGKYGATLFEEGANVLVDSYVEYFYGASWEAAREKAVEYLKELQKMPKDEIIEIDE